jgi:hypothetical protein
MVDHLFTVKLLRDNNMLSGTMYVENDAQSGEFLSNALQVLFRKLGKRDKYDCRMHPRVLHSFRGTEGRALATGCTFSPELCAGSETPGHPRTGSPTKGRLV